MITVISYYWEITGRHFSPSKAENQSHVAFSTKHEVGDASSRVPNLIYDYGYATLKHGRPLRYWPLSTEDVLVAMIEKNAAIFRECGADQITMFCTFSYDDQCNFEFKPEELKRLTGLGAALAISCVQLDEEDSGTQDE